jgi:polyribonucleotide nucleotidyltransferase
LRYHEIGPGGRIIKGIQDGWGVKIKMPKLEDPSTSVIVEGRPDAAENARKQISKILGFQVNTYTHDILWSHLIAKTDRKSTIVNSSSSDQSNSLWCINWYQWCYRTKH